MGFCRLTWQRAKHGVPLLGWAGSEGLRQPCRLYSHDTASPIEDFDLLLRT
jgi:hypothetical protein